MRSFGSGRLRTRNQGFVEQSLPLDIRELRRRGCLRAGRRVSGTCMWNRAGRRVGALSFIIDVTDPANCRVVLEYAVGGEPRVASIELEAIPCRYGGHRYYFRCPRLGRRCMILCCIEGEFASRHYHRLSYASQSEGPLGRLGQAMVKAEALALGRNGHPRPRGQNRERLVGRWQGLASAWAQKMLQGTTGRQLAK